MAAAGPFALVTSCAGGFNAEELVKRESPLRRGAPAWPARSCGPRARQLLTLSPGPQGAAPLPSRTGP